MINFRIDTKNALDTPAYKQIKRIKDKLGNLDEALFQAGKTLRNRMRKRILDQVNADGNPLTPLRPRTVFLKTLAGSKTPNLVLRETDNLLDTINFVATKRTLRLQDRGFGGRHENGIWFIHETTKKDQKGREINRNIILDTLTRSKLNQADNDYLKNYIYRFLRK